MRPRFQFSLRFVLCWLVPYVAIVTVILAHDGWADFIGDVSNSKVKTQVLIAVTYFWAISAARYSYPRRNVSDPDPPPAR